MLYQQPQSGPVQIDYAIGADFAWTASVGGVKGPSVSGATASRAVTKAGLAINSGYAVINGVIPSIYATTWTECGVVLLDGTNTIVSLSARDTGQAVIFNPSTPAISLVMWGIVSVDIAGSLPTGIVHYVAKRDGNSHKVWLNGKLFGAGSSSSTSVAANGTLPAIGASAGSGGELGHSPLVATNGMLSVVRTAIALTDAQCQSISANHWQLFLDEEEEESLLYVQAAGGGVTADLSKTLGAVTASAAAVVDVAGALTKTMGAVTSSGAGSVAIAANLSKTLDATTLAATGAVAVSAAGTSTLSAVATSSAVVVAVAGTLSKTLGGAALTSAGTVAITGAASTALGGVTATAAGAVVVGVALAKTLGAVTLVANGVTDGSAHASLTQTLGAAALASAGTIQIAGAAAPTLGATTLAAGTQVATAGVLDLTMGAMTLSSRALVRAVEEWADAPRTRTLAVAADNRMLRIQAESRIPRAAAENRTFSIARDRQPITD